LAILYPTPESQ